MTHLPFPAPARRTILDLFARISPHACDRRRHASAIAIAKRMGVAACLFAALTASIGLNTSAHAQPADTVATNQDPQTTQAFDQHAYEQAVLAAFLATHNGFSVDETLIQPDLHQAFLAECQRRIAHNVSTNAQTNPVAFAETLLHLRKTGQVGHVTTQRVPRPTLTTAQRNRCRFAVEIAARQIQAEHNAHTDDILVNPQLRQAFLKIAHQTLTPTPGTPGSDASEGQGAEHTAHTDHAAANTHHAAPEPEHLASGGSGGGLTDAVLLRDALRLRKQRQLRPELVARVVDWDKQVAVFDAQALAADDALRQTLPSQPGVYIFYDATGYLYIGEAKNLKTRLTEHVTGSDRDLLAEYLAKHADAASIQIEVHAFDPASNARLVAHRRAYESDLIATRHPRFNVRP